MSTARKLLYAFGLLALAIIVVGVFLPARGEVRREITIDAPAVTVFALLEDLRRVRDWLPWVPAGEKSRILAQPEGAGASMRWGGPPAGSFTVVESVPGARVVGDLAVGEEEAALSATVTDAAPGTRVRLAYEARFGIDLPARYRGLFLESRVGPELDAGLRALATLAESLPRADWSDISIEREVVEPTDIAYLTARSKPDAASVSEAMGKAYFDILEFMDRHGLEEAGAPLSISRRFDGSELVFDAAIPVRGVTPETPREDGAIRLGKTWGGPVVRGRHVGSYATLRRTHEKIAAYLAAHGIPRAGDAWEAYVSDPTRTPEDRLITDVYYPIANPAPSP